LLYKCCNCISICQLRVLQTNTAKTLSEMNVTLNEIPRRIRKYSYLQKCVDNRVPSNLLLSSNGVLTYKKNNYTKFRYSYIWNVRSEMSPIFLENLNFKFSGCQDHDYESFTSFFLQLQIIAMSTDSFSHLNRQLSVYSFRTSKMRHHVLRRDVSKNTLKIHIKSHNFGRMH
jgi:hypothetical protein